VTPNSALLTDTHCSPLRARCGAARTLGGKAMHWTLHWSEDA